MSIHHSPQIYVYNKLYDFSSTGESSVILQAKNTMI